MKPLNDTGKCHLFFIHAAAIKAIRAAGAQACTAYHRIAAHQIAVIPVKILIAHGAFG